LWSEYKATGNKQIIDRLIKVITTTTPSKANNLRVPVKQFLIKIARYHSEVFAMLYKRPESSIGEIVSIIHDSAFRPADEHLGRGLNLYYEKKCNEAMQEFNKSLSYVPDYCSTYMNIANIYDDVKMMKEAIKAGKRAVSIEPDNPGALSNLGFYYQRLNEQDEAIKWYQKCLECDPKKIDCHYGLGLAYNCKRDNNKAAIHFKKYLEYAPNGKYVASVRQNLASMGQNVEEDLTNVAVMLQNKRYDALEKHLLSLLRGKNRDKDGQSPLNLAYGRLCDVQEPERSYFARIAQFKSWLTQYNSSHFANACLGIVHINYAWHARGSGYANTITEEGGRLLKERLLTAKEYLEKAYSLDQSDPNVPAHLITVAMGLGLDRKEVERQFRRAILADPVDDKAYYAKFEYLKPKWYGSEEEMFSFAREAVRKAPPNSTIPTVLIGAHLEMYYQSYENKSYFRNANVWKEMKEVFKIVSKSFPESKNIHNWFAKIAYLAGDYEVARQELKKVGDDWNKKAWANKETFEQVKRELLAR
jgi:tetratricopeptide (TPR) repeat protein